MPYTARGRTTTTATRGASVQALQEERPWQSEWGSSAQFMDSGVLFLAAVCVFVFVVASFSHGSAGTMVLKTKKRDQAEHEAIRQKAAAIERIRGEAPALAHAHALNVVNERVAFRAANPERSLDRPGPSLSEDARMLYEEGAARRRAEDDRIAFESAQRVRLEMILSGEVSEEDARASATPVDYEAIYAAHEPASTHRDGEAPVTAFPAALAKEGGGDYPAAGLCLTCKQPVSTGGDLSLGMRATWCNTCGWEEVEDWSSNETYGDAQ